MILLIFGTSLSLWMNLSKISIAIVVHMDEVIHKFHITGAQVLYMSIFCDIPKCLNFTNYSYKPCVLILHCQSLVTIVVLSGGKNTFWVMYICIFI
ncbi:hypothetical protein PRUPE_4G233500 [Prunus persica]|uniref:Uncharacterized protein n=1 Tax=Prunus persica TaxID=3760 RepID=A0A251PPY7_PRUPE|nr:hypothetical protein PRUPE_4G233500 [Prunus persica]